MQIPRRSPAKVDSADAGIGVPLPPLAPLSASRNLQGCGGAAERGEVVFRGEGGSLASPFPPEKPSPPPGSLFRGRNQDGPGGGAGWGSTNSPRRSRRHDDG